MDINIITVFILAIFVGFEMFSNGFREGSQEQPAALPSSQYSRLPSRKPFKPHSKTSENAPDLSAGFGR